MVKKSGLTCFLFLQIKYERGGGEGGGGGKANTIFAQIIHIKVKLLSLFSFEF